MNNNEQKKTNHLVEGMLSLENEFYELVYENYKERKELDKSFYEKMKSILELFEVRLGSMRDELEDPNLIQIHDVR